MNGQKKENLLNLSLDATEEEREKSPALRVGTDSEDKRWEVIVKYNGNLEPIQAAFPEMEAYPLSGGYAVIRTSESQIEPLAGFSQIEYMEKPKRLYFSVDKGKSDSCITRVQEGPRGLTGRGVITAVIDSGIDYFHEAFRDAAGKTRILELWDQDRDIVYGEAQINEALETGSRAAAYEVVPSRDVSGHGTAVAGIAAGSGMTLGSGEGGLGRNESRNRGIAYESRLLIVKLGTSLRDSFPRTTELMRALDYVVRRSVDFEMPVAVNLSFGNTYGSHDGTSLVETYLDTIAAMGRTVVVAGTGNEGNSRGHTSGVLSNRGRVSGRPGRAGGAGNLERAGDTGTVEAELIVGGYETGFGVQLWKQYVDRFSVELISPGGISTGPISPVLGSQRITFRNTTVLLYYGMPSPYSKAQEIYFDFIPRQSYVESGVWKFRLIPEEIVSGIYDFWLPAEQVLNRETHFLYSTPDTTLTIPSTAARAITVGAYDDSYQAYADFSGRGFNRLDQGIKPDLTAPGVNIVTARTGGGYEAMTGTSFAAPFVTGSAALMMQWGIVDGNDPYLYGEKLKAYLLRGARPLPGEEVYPNPRLGYGTLCLDASFP